MQHFAVFSDFFAVKMNQNEPRDRSRAVLSFDRRASTLIFDVEKKKERPDGLSFLYFRAFRRQEKAKTGLLTGKTGLMRGDTRSGTAIFALQKRSNARHNCQHWSVMC